MAENTITVSKDIDPSRYASCENGTGDLIIYDRKQHTAWIQSDDVRDVFP